MRTGLHDFKRISAVGAIRIKSIQFSSVFQVGDNAAVTPTSRALAVQRQISEYNDEEGDFGFPIYKRKIRHMSLTEPLELTRRSVDPFITVDRVNIFGISVSAVFQVGSNRLIDSDSRTKHIRQFITDIPESPSSSSTLPGQEEIGLHQLP
ncbi:spore germination protein GerPE [Marinicrinis lubricantis]|uniref:Spore germination protein GerPE n=1 Tax=Marinicrinis lubricantis TaxID=2086470 RepID=A0ABW1IL38_9BACL